MIDTTVDQESFAIQGLLALRDCDSLNGSNKSSSPQSFVTTPELNEISEISKHPSKSNSVINYGQKKIETLPNPASFTRYDHQYQMDQSKDLKQQDYRDHQSYLAQQAFIAQQIRHSHQYQVARPADPYSGVKLPSIKEMLSQHPSTNLRYQSSSAHVDNETLAKSSHTSNIQRYPNMPSEKINENSVYTEAKTQSSVGLCQCYQKHHMAGGHSKNQYMPPNSNQRLNMEAILPGNDLQKSMENIRALSDSDLYKFISGLRQHFRNEYDREFKCQQKENYEKFDSGEPQNSDIDDSDIDDNQSEYRLSSDNSYGSNSNASLINNNSKRAKTERTRNCIGSVEKPRWTTEEKIELLDAVIKHKSLDVMSTFDWSAIGADAGRTDKACKDQWRRGILKLFREYVSRL